MVLFPKKQAWPSKNLKEFSEILSALDQPETICFSPYLGNGFLLWDLRQAYMIEQWIVKHDLKLKLFPYHCYFMAYNSWEILPITHPSYSYPKLGGKRDCPESVKGITSFVGS